jgi:hypothetical protein
MMNQQQQPSSQPLNSRLTGQALGNKAAAGGSFMTSDEGES